MKRIRYISRKEHVALLIVAGVFMAIVVVAFAGLVVEDYNRYVFEHQRDLRSLADGTPAIRFSGSNYRPTIGGLNLLIVFIFFSILGARKYYLSFALTLFYAASYIYSFHFRYYAGREVFEEVSYLEIIASVIYPFEFVAGFFIAVLLVWQVSILARFTVKFLRSHKLS